MSVLVETETFEELKNQLQNLKTANKFEPNWHLQTLLHVLGLI